MFCWSKVKEGTKKPRNFLVELILAEIQTLACSTAASLSNHNCKKNNIFLHIVSFSCLDCWPRDYLDDKILYNTTAWQEIVLSHLIFRTIANKVLESLILNRNLQTTSLYHVRKFYSYLNYWKAMRHMHNPKFMNKVIKWS